MLARISGRRPLLTPSVAAIAASLLLASAAAAQQPQPEEEATLGGVVRDAASGAEIAGAVVRVGERGRAVMTNQDGRFRIENLEPGTRWIVASQLGYDTLRTQVEVGPGSGILTLSLNPDPIMLERVTAMVDRFEAHRNSLGSSVRVFDRARLVTSSAFDALDFLQMRTSLFLTRCPSRVAMGSCAFVRGRPIEVQLIIDGATVVGGLDILAAYRPDELYTLEVIGGGRAVRVYTNWYVETIAEGRRLPPDFIF